MSSSNRRGSAAGGPTAKRPPAAMAENAVGPTAKTVASASAAAQQARKRVALGNITNVVVGPTTGRIGSNLKGNSTATSTFSTARKSSTFTSTTRNPNPLPSRSSISKPASAKPATVPSIHQNAMQNKNVGPTIALPTAISAACNNGGIFVASPGRSGDSVSVEETMSPCDSMKSPDFEYIDNGDSSSSLLLASLQQQAKENLRISEDIDVQGVKWKKDAPVAMAVDRVFDVDDNLKDPQLCATIACDIYKHLREAETKKRPSTDYMERIQKDINASMRAILIDWLVEVAEEYRLVPDTLYLTVNYIDRYLSGNEINRQRLQLLGVACMLIASKYEEICAPQVEEFCYITDNTYFKDEILQMESSVLNYLKFEMTAPTAKCFLRRFLRAAQVCDEGAPLQLEFLASYVAELALLEYSFLCYASSLVAASSIFLAKFILQPTKHPWNATLAHYTQYKPCELSDCVKALHRLFCVGPGSNLPAIREKYSQHKYKFVAKKYCSPTIPSVYFQDASS